MSDRRPTTRRVGWATLLAILLAGGVARAHSPDLSTYVVSREADGWVLTVHLSSAGLHAALSVAGADLSEVDVPTYQAMTLDAVREGLALVADGRPLAVGPGQVWLGSHQTALRFALPDAPRQIASLEGSRVSSLRQVRNQHNVLRLRSATVHEQWVLAERNDYTLTADVIRARALRMEARAEPSRPTED